MTHANLNADKSCRPRAVHGAAAAVALLLTGTAVAQPPVATTVPAYAGRPPLPFGRAAFDIPPAVERVELSPQQLALLTEYLAAASGSERVGGIAGLTQYGPAAAPLATHYLVDADPTARAEAARVLGLIGDPSAAAALMPVLADADATVRREAVLAAAALRRDDAVTAALDDADDRVRLVALAGVRTAAQATRVAALVPTESPAVKEQALAALGRVDALSHAQTIVGELHAASVAVRIAALDALGRTEHPDLAAQAMALLNDPHPAVRRAALRAAGRLAPTGVDRPIVSAALAALGDADLTVRAAAADVLRGHPTVKGLAPLLQQLAIGDDALRRAAREALAALGKAAVPAAETLLADPTPARRADGSYLLGRLRSQASLARHVALLDETDWAVVGQAARSLQEIGPSRDAVAPFLDRLLRRMSSFSELSDAEADAVGQAILLGGRVGDAGILDFLPPLIPVRVAADDAPDAIRLPAIWAIGVLGRPDTPALRTLHQVTAATQKPTAIFERLKAQINLGDRSAQAEMDAWASDPVLSRQADCRWIAHWGSDYFGGRRTPFTPAILERKATVAVRPL